MTWPPLWIGAVALAALYLDWYLNLRKAQQ